MQHELEIAAALKNLKRITQELRSLRDLFHTHMVSPDITTAFIYHKFANIVCSCNQLRHLLEGRGIQGSQVNGTKDQS